MTEQHDQPSTVRMHLTFIAEDGKTIPASLLAALRQYGLDFEDPDGDQTSVDVPMPDLTVYDGKPATLEAAAAPLLAAWQPIADTYGVDLDVWCPLRTSVVGRSFVL